MSGQGIDPVTCHLMAGLDGQPRLIAWTGERCVPWADDVQMIYEHYHRYALSARFVAGKRVLDLASGEGYGAALLAQTAREVVGIELDEATVRHARAAYAHFPNLRFEQGSIVEQAALPEQGVFDVITCFEAIEHVEQQNEPLALARPHLVENGIFLASTPDTTVYSGERGNENPFHLRELTEEEFRSVLSKYFSNVELLRQDVVVGSLMVGEGSAGTRNLDGPVVAQTLRPKTDASWAVGEGVPHTYLVAVASDGPLDSIPTTGVLADPQLTLLSEHIGAAQRANEKSIRLQEERDALEAEVVALRRPAVRHNTAAALVARSLSAVGNRGLSPGTHGKIAAWLRKFRRDEKSQHGGIDLAVSGDPLVTIVIPVHGQWEYTRRCLLAIASSQPTVPYEVVVVDDASPDETASQLARCSGIRIAHTEHNLGFVRAANLGASQAHGRLLVFLNNDTEVTAGWLDALVHTAQSADDIGLVGATLIYPDGRLQECGGIVWADGSAANYGNRDDPHKGRYKSVREVDYCSGAALLVRQDLFERLGRFDERYSPGYYEDTDLAFAARTAGYRTIVDPHAVVIHHEGVSHGTDLTSGVKRFQETNRAVFTAKWQDTLTSQRAGANSADAWLAAQRVANMQPCDDSIVLIADLHVPTPDRDSGSARMWQLINTLIGLGQRVVFCPMEDTRPARYTEQLVRAGVTVLADEQEREEFLRDVGSSLRRAILSRPTVAWHLAERIRICAPRADLVYDTVDLHFLRLSREASLVEGTGEIDTARMLRQRADLYRELELALVRACDSTVVVSDTERALLADLVPTATVNVVSNVHRVSNVGATPEGRTGAMFVGSFAHAPNRDAAYWLAGEIWPLVRQSLPHAQLELVGDDPTGEICHLAGDGVSVPGWVADLEAKYSTARMTLAPLRFGSGVKGKVGESLAAGIPAIGTGLAFEGMDLRDGEDMLMADSVADIAGRVVTLFNDDLLWQKMSNSGQRAVSAQFGPEAARRALEDLLAQDVSV